ncbi:MAG TPA: hypothetical protein VNT02_04765 [Burkholderiales bacterium]|nr:hypothetical protein [Burkholderiales bacterium]
MSDASMQRRIVAGILVVAAVVLGTRQLLQVSREVAFFTVVPLLIVCFSWMLYRELKSFFSDGVNTEGRSQERGD